ncbi:MAG: hypothetical protein Kapaf2KO_19480 [Candidatus Kapaibacteriales bacterium]
MADLEDKLTPEEESGGFEAFDGSDDSFEVEGDGVYDGKMPEAFDSKEKPIFDSASGTSLSGKQASEPNPRNIESDNSVDENVSDESISKEEESGWDLDDDEEVIDVSEESKSSSIESEQNVTTDSPLPNPGLSDSDQPMDEDLKNLLQSELDRSKEQKTDKVAEEPIIEDKPIVESQGEPGETAEMDFSEIEATSPSKMGIEDIEEDSFTEDISANESSTDTEENQSSETESSKVEPESTLPPPPIPAKKEKKEEEKKKRGVGFWLGAAAAVLLLIGLSSFFTYLLTSNDGPDEDYAALYQKLKDEGVRFEIPVEADSTEWINEKLSELVDGESPEGIIFPTESEDLATEELVDEIEKDSSTLEEENEIKDEAIDNDKKDVADVSNNSLSASATSSPKVDEPVRKNPFRKSEKKEQTSTSEIDRYNDFENNLANNKEEETKPKQVFEKEEEPVVKTKQLPSLADDEDESENEVKTDLATNINTNANINTDSKPKNLDNDALYTIQVFSSLNKSDAEIWKNKIESRDIGKVSISSQKIRDEVWYRVRVGEYPSKESALSAARKLGYAQIWVDRVR